jgi:hypothetical protein
MVFSVFILIFLLDNIIPATPANNNIIEISNEDKSSLKKKS